MPDDVSTPPPPAISDDQLNRAFSAFKKRIKLTRLDMESRLGASRPMTGGKDASDISIKPPNDFPPPVWKELARQNRIKDTGGGFYKLP
jgi:hypothetical protein